MGGCPSHTVPLLGRNARPCAHFTHIMPPPPPPTKIASKPMLSSSHSTKILYKYCWKNTYIVFYMRKIIKSY